jgi:hypothetical protein
MKKFLAGLLMICILSACESTTAKTGPVVEIGPIQVGLSLNSIGEFELDTTVSVPIIAEKDLGVGLTWDTTLSTVLGELNNRSNYLVVLWQNANGDFKEQDYPIGQSFEITFEHDQWVRYIKHTAGGNIVVIVEKQRFPTFVNQTSVPNLPQVMTTVTALTITDSPSAHIDIPDIIVSAKANNGVKFIATEDGYYQFTMLDGVYCTPIICRSIIHGYLDRNIIWENWYGNPHPMDQDYEIGCWEQQTAENINCGNGMSVEVYLKANQYINWVIMEDKNSFADNTGEIRLSVKKIS